MDSRKLCYNWIGNGKQLIMDLESMRKHYQLGTLEVENLIELPYLQLEAWLEHAATTSLTEPNAMVLATAGRQGEPSARTVLLKQLDSRGLVWFSHWGSRKGREINENPWASVCFSWPLLERQVVVRGLVHRLSDDDNDRYWKSRPRANQLGSSSSPQSQPIPSREWLEERIDGLEAAHPGPIPRPRTWGGMRLVPKEWEFWQGGPGRVHDRFLYQLENDAWKITRLAP